MFSNKAYIPLILAAGFISTNAFAQSSTNSAADQKATRAEIETLTKRIEELAKKLDGDTKVRIMIVEKSESADGKTVERKMITSGPDSKEMRWNEKQGGSDHMKFKKSGQPRVGLGIVMSPNTAGSGVKIAAVSPKGPAKDAGLQAGDIITAIDGKAISGKDSAGLEQARTTLKNLKEGQSVKIAYSRAGKNAVSTVKAGAIEREMIVNREMRYPSPPGAPHNMAYATRWQGLNMAELNPQLGRYFGTSSGVLVLSPNKGFASLQPGDVITKIDGKAVVSARDVLRNMRGKKEGEKINLDILRDRKALTISVTAPKPPAMDIPPPPPAPQAPPPPKAPKTTSSVAPPAPPPPPHAAMFISDSGETTTFFSTTMNDIGEANWTEASGNYEIIMLDDNDNEFVQEIEIK